MVHLACAVAEIVLRKVQGLKLFGQGPEQLLRTQGGQAVGAKLRLVLWRSHNIYGAIWMDMVGRLIRWSVDWVAATARRASENGCGSTSTRKP